jgi:hypothetical protein
MAPANDNVLPVMPYNSAPVTIGFYNTPDNFFFRLLHVRMINGCQFTEEMVQQITHILNNELLSPYLERGRFQIARTRWLILEVIQNIAWVEFDYIVESLSQERYAEEMIDYLPSLGIITRRNGEERLVLLAEEGSVETLCGAMREFGYL